MQFIPNGPDIPDALLKAHEEGQVVFFCGAGISYPAGLPGFQGLVDKIYEQVGSNQTPIEQEAYNRNEFDATLDLLERRLPGQRLTVRSALKKILQPKLRRKGATDTHSALLQLSHTREGILRLVTTNFDHVFEKVAKRNKQKVNSYAAPMFPIPKNSKWNGIVYLHGLLPKADDDSSALNRLVLTSGDFGLAYLTERWASRFVSELFRNYVVCFIGYSINDPVLRYMMDALAADRMLGEFTPQAYALGDCQLGQERAKTIEWEAKGVTPILYEVKAGSNDHSAMHDTLKSWAETYRDGILGKERIVVDYALTRPSVSTQQDDFVGRMLWAISHESGLPAKSFADFNPVPSLEWLEAFSEQRYHHSDLEHFGVPPKHDIDKKLKFSLSNRPSPYTHAPWMTLVSIGVQTGQLDRVMFQIARWLVRHLNDASLIIWFVEHGSNLHSQLSWLIDHELDRILSLKREGKVAELNEIKANAPNAIPSSEMVTLWRFLLTGRVKSSRLELDLYSWASRLKNNDLTTTLRLQLRELLAPKVQLKKPFNWSEYEEKSDSPQRLKQLVDWELELATDHVDSAINELEKSEKWQSSLPLLFNDFQQLLHDALDILNELGEADEQNDRSYWDLPSISNHWQNRGYRDWVTLITLLRDAWIAILKINSNQAMLIAKDWFFKPYPTYKRLALFAASHDDCIPTSTWLQWLLMNDSWWLWSLETQRETMRLLILQGAKLSNDEKLQLEVAILAGPPRKMYRDDLETERWNELIEHSIWLHLAKLQEGGCVLSKATLLKFQKVSSANLNWKLAKNEQDEFSHWMSGTGDPDYEEERNIDVAPRKWRELISWLKQTKATNQPFYEDTWQNTCRTRLFHSLYALCSLAKEGTWPAERWREALQTWSNEELANRSWRFAAPLILSMPDELLKEIAHGLSYWLKAISKSVDRHENILLKLCLRILAISHSDGVDNEQPITRAINHPVGHITEVLLNYWFIRKPNDNDNLPEDIEPIFTWLCNTEIEQFCHARVILGSRLITLFRVDPLWTETNFLPLLDWKKNPIEANAVWSGFLWSPRLYEPLLIAFREQFLATAQHYDKLGKHGGQFASFLTYAALNYLNTYTPKEFNTAFSSLPQRGLEKAAQALSQALESSGEQKEDYWNNRIEPFWQQVWPKSRDLASNRIAESLGRMSLAAGNKFPSALTTIIDWIQPIEHPFYIAHRLYESKLSEQFPEQALTLLYAIIDEQPYPHREMTQCLAAIIEADSKLENDPRYQKLSEYLRRHGT
jgi:hypothetical protein